MIFAHNAGAVSARKGGCPATSSYSTTPSDQMSERASMLFEARTCSGDMYCGEPMIAPVAVRTMAGPWSSARDFATPKSSTFTRAEPSERRVRNRFEGFRSR
jgi:hypothetical protein